MGTHWVRQRQIVERTGTFVFSERVIWCQPYFPSHPEPSVDAREESEKLPPLNYYTPHKRTYKVGATIPARIVAGIASLVFAGFSPTCLIFISSMGDRPYWGAGFVVGTASVLLLLV